MEKTVQFRDRQELQAADLNNMQTYTRSSLDHLVADAVSDHRRYTGFVVTQAATTGVDVSAGRLYDAGKVYGSGAATTRDLLNSLPVSTRRIVSVVAYGETVETGVEPRDFLINLDDNTTEPQSVAMTAWRKAQVDFIAGVESSQPAPPAIPTSALRIADITLTPTRIEKITPASENRLIGVAENADAVGALNVWRRAMEPVVSNLSATVAGLETRTASKAGMRQVIAIHEQLAMMRRELDAPVGVSWAAFDDFRDDTRSDTIAFSDAAYDIRDELLFPPGGEQAVNFDLFNPLESKIRATPTGWLLPTFSEVPLVPAGDAAGTVTMSSYTVQTRERRRVQRFRVDHHSGSRFDGYAVSATLDAQYRNGNMPGPGSVHANVVGLDQRGDIRTQAQVEQAKESIRSAMADYGPTSRIDYTVTRRSSSYSYTTRTPYYEYEYATSTETVSGATLAQTVLAPGNAILTAVELSFNQLDASGDVTVEVMGVEDGKPKESEVWASTTLPHANLTTDGMVRVPLDVPVRLESGRRYAVVLTTNGSHVLNTTSDGRTLQGLVMHGTANGYWDHTLEDHRALRMTLLIAAFDRVRTEVRLGDVSLTGGISELEISTEMDVPDGTELTFEYQFGGHWYPMSRADAMVANTPSTLPIRVIFNGTTTLQPMIKSGSQRVFARQTDDTLRHYSALRTLPAPTDTVYVDMIIGLWQDSGHTLEVTLLDADDGMAEIAAAQVTDLNTTPATMREDGTITQWFVKRRWRFDVSGLQAFHIKTSGSLTGAVRPFTIHERYDQAVVT